MSASEALTGLNCPRCGGIVPIPEGEAVVKCPYCELASLVSGEKGVRRYQVSARVTIEQAQAALQNFLKSSLSIAPGVRREARVNEAFQVFLPFWTGWGRALAWGFGQKQVGSGDKKRWEARERKVMRDMNWNTAACDVGEFGVTRISLEGRPLTAFDPEELHAAGMVFEPSGSAVEALAQAKAEFENQARQEIGLDRISQLFVHILRPRLGLVYYPLWILRYTYRGRIFQVVVDGYSGEVLFGKAPGSVAFRAAALVGGMAAGAFTAVTLPALIARNTDEGELELLLVLLIAGAVMMLFAYRKYRYGEHYEYQRYQAATNDLVISLRQITGIENGGVMEILRDLERMK